MASLLKTLKKHPVVVADGKADRDLSLCTTRRSTTS
jgi:hypothetical protein